MTIFSIEKTGPQIALLVWAEQSYETRRQETFSTLGVRLIKPFQVEVHSLV